MQRLKETRRRPRIHQRRPHRVPHKIMHKTSLPKPYLRLRRMHIHIHFLRRHLQKQQHHRIRSRRNDIPVSLRKRMQNQTVANQPPIHKHINRVPIELLQLRLTHKPAQPYKPRLRRLIILATLPRRRLRQPRPGEVHLRRHGNQALKRLPPKDLKQPLTRIRHRRRHQQRLRR